MVWKNVAGGLLVTAPQAWVPQVSGKVFFKLRTLSSNRLGTDYRTNGHSALIRLFGRQHSAGCSALEWRNQPGGVIAFIYADLIVSRSSTSTQILWLESDRFRRRRLFFRNGRGCLIIGLFRILD